MLALAWLAYFYWGCLSIAFAPILPAIERDLHISSTSGGLLLGAYPLTYVLSSLAIGRVCDRLGVKLSTAIGLLVIAVSMALRSVSYNFGLMLVAATMLGVGGPVVSTVLPKLVAERFEGPQRTLASGIYVTGPSVGAALVLLLTNSVFVPALGGSWRLLCLCQALFGVLVLGLWWWLATNVSPVRPAPAAAEGLDAAPHPSDASAHVVTPARPLWRLPSVWMPVLVGVVGFAIGQGYASWLPSILEAKGYSPSAAGLWASVCRLSQVPGSVGLCYLITRLTFQNSRKYAVMGLLVVQTITVALVAAPLGIGLYPLLVVQGAASGALLPILLSIIMDLPAVSASQMGMAAALYFTVGQIAGAGAPVGVGWLRDMTGGFTAGLLAVAGFAFVCLLPASRMVDARHPIARRSGGGAPRPSDGPSGSDPIGAESL
jgi:cyanate permease